MNIDSRFINTPTNLNARGNQTGDTEQYVGIVDMICEGPIKGLVDGKRSIFLNNVPFEDAKNIGSPIISDGAYQIPTLNIANGGTSGTADGYTFSTDDVGKYIVIEIKNKEFGNTEITVGGAINGYLMVTLNDGTSNTIPTTYDNNLLFAKFTKGTSLTEDTLDIEGEVNVNTTSHAHVFRAAISPTNITINDTATHTLRIYAAFKIASVNTSNNTMTLDTASGESYATSWPQTNGNWHFWVQDAKPVEPSLIGPGAAIAGNIKKVEASTYQFHRGRADQGPFSDINGVGGGITITGTGANTPVKQPATLPSEVTTLGFSYADTVFDGRGKYDTAGYPEGQSFADNSGTAVSIPALGGGSGLSFGLTASQIYQVDEINIRISYPALYTLNVEKGDKESAHAHYVFQIQTQLDSVSSGWKTLFSQHGGSIIHSGKTTAPTAFDHTIGLNRFKPFDNFTIRIVRLTRPSGMPVWADGTAGGRTDRDKWQMQGTAAINGGGLNATIKDKLTYPHTAAASITFSSKEFSNLPQRSYLLEGLKVRIPNTYTPREYTTNGVAQYSGFWNGTFKDKLYYTDNPAWIFYDIITNQRYGAGKWIHQNDINEFALYRIAQYCDELVPSGEKDTNGNDILEPRFRANFYLSKSTEIFKVLKDMASMFTGMLYWMDGKLNVIQDIPSEPIYNFSSSNVIDGVFGYEGTSRKNRTNQVIVTWNDPIANYEPVALVVEDREAIASSGRLINENAVAMGATSEGQAYRFGRWKLWTAQNQKEIVSFKTGLQGTYIRPGDVINVQDNNRYGIQLSGRISSSTAPTSNTITLDRPINILSGTYTLHTLVESYAAFYTGLNPITINSVTYNKGDRITGQLYVNGSLTTINSEETASNAKATSSAAGTPVPLTWKPYTYIQENTVSTGAGNNITTLTTTANFGTTPDTGTVWALSRVVSGKEVLGSVKQYKVLAVSQEDDKNTFGITAVEYYIEKYDAVDKDYALGVVEGGVYSPNEDSEAAVPAPDNIFVVLETDAKQPGEELRIEWEKPQEEFTDSANNTQTRDYEFFAGYEFIHNIPNSPSPMFTEQTSIRFDNVPDGIYTFRVRTLSNKGNSSGFISTQYEVEDPYGTNVARMQGGIVKGGKSNAQLSINANNQASFEVSPAVFASLGDPLNTRNISNTYSLTGLALSTSYYIYVGSSLTVVYWDELSLRNLPFWREITASSSHLSSQASKWTSLGSVSLPKNSNTLTGSGFNSSLALRDVICFGEEIFPYKSISDVSVSGSTVTISTNSTSGSEDPHGLTDGDRVLIKGVTDLEDRYFYVDVQNSYNFTLYDDYDPATGTFSNLASNFTASNLTSYSSGGTFQQIHADAAIVTAIISNTEVRLDRAFDHAISTTAYRSDFRPDYQQHAIVAEVQKTGSNTYSIDPFLIIDPTLTSSTRELIVDSNIFSLQYNSDESQVIDGSGDPVGYSNITLTATGLNFLAPEFKVTGAGFSATSGSADTGFTLASSGTYSKVIDDASSTIAWSNGSPLQFTVQVREKNDPSNSDKSITKTFSIFKTKNGSIGLSGKTVKLEAEDYTILYNAQGQNPSFNDQAVSAWSLSANTKLNFAALFRNFTTPIYRVLKTVGGTETVVTDWTDSFAASNAQSQGSYLLTYEFTPSATYSQSDYPVNIKIQAGEKPSSWSSGTAPTTIEAVDSISVVGVKEGTGGVVISNPNAAHSYTTDKNGNVGTGTTGLIPNSGTLIEVLIGGVTGDYDGNSSAVGRGENDSTLEEGQWYIASAAVEGASDLTIGSLSVSGDIVVIGSHTAVNTSHSSGNPTDDNEVITYTIKAKVGRTVKTLTTQQSLSKSKTGADGSSVTGPAGSDGEPGARTVGGVVYYQTAQSSAPTIPAASSFSANFTSGTFNYPSGWGPSPPTAVPATSATYWYFHLTITESGTWSSSGYPSVTKTASPGFGSSATQGIGFTGLVTFSGNNLVSGSSTYNPFLYLNANGTGTGTATTTTINGAHIRTGTITADRLTAISSSTVNGWLGYTAADDSEVLAFSTTEITGGKIVLKTNGLILGDNNTTSGVAGTNRIIMDTTSGNNAIKVYDNSSSNPRVIIGKLT